MKNAFKRTVFAVLTAVMLFSLCGCIESGPEGNTSQATPTSIEEVRYNWLSLFDKKNEIYSTLTEKNYDFEADPLGFNPIDVEMVLLGQVMPTIDDYITVSELYKLEKRVDEVTAAINELYEAVREL